MKIKNSFSLFKIGLAMLCTLCATAWAESRKTCIDANWHFVLGCHTEAVMPGYNDAGWRTLSLPHDWSVEPDAAAMAGNNVGPFTPNNPGGKSLGYQTAQTVGGEGWYRKMLTFSKEQMRGRVLLYFEGAYNHTTVYVNGREMFFNPYGYSSFYIDVTPALRPAGQSNTVAVRVQNEGLNTRWYSGSGIYRHVWLICKPNLSLNAWHTFVSTTRLNDAQATVHVSARVTSCLPKHTKAVATVKLVDPNHAVVTQKSVELTVMGDSSAIVDMDLNVNSPQPWSPESPQMYKAKITLKSHKCQTDRLTIPFGIRTLAWNATQGLLLNGKSIKLRGGCVHHDNGLLGAASYDKAELHKVRLLKQYGFNAVRCAHNIPAEYFLHACDSLGMLVLDEAFDQWLVAKNTDDYHNYFASHSKQDVQTMVRRDRNHPSVIFWGIGNEIPGRIEPSGLQAARQLRQYILELDSTRPVTAAISDWDTPWHNWDDESAKAFNELDVGGYNYMYYHYLSDHKRYPNRIMMGTESYPKRAAENWELVEKYPFVIGDFVWTAMDYIGEAGIGHTEIMDNGKHTAFARPWPWFNGWCGDIDLLGNKKPQSYYRDVVWHIRPITMAVEAPIPAGKSEQISQWGWQDELQSWTWPHRTPADTMTVNVYSRAPRVRLYLNNQLVGEQPTSATYWAGFRVPYHTGQLRAVAVDGGVEGASFTLETTGEPAGLRLVTADSTLQASGTDLAYVVAELVDARGHVVSDSTRQVHFTVTGNGTLLAGGNANPCDQLSFRSAAPRLFRGRAMAIVKSDVKSGTVVVNASCDGLPAQQIEIRVR